MMHSSVLDTVRLSALTIAMAFICALLFVAPANADSEVEAKEPGPLKCSVDGADSGKSCNCRERHEGYLFSVIVPCIRDEVIAATKRTTNAFAPFLEGAMMAFLTLVVILFGVKVLLAEGDPKKEGFILLLKIGGVLAFIGNYDALVIDPAFGIMQQGVELTTGVFNITAEHCQEYLTEYPNAAVPWIHYDCVLGKLMGFGGDMFVGGAALGLAATALWSGQFGSIFFMGAMMSIFFLIKLILRGVYSYLMAVIALALLIFISPLLIPLFWLQITQQFFDRWLSSVIAMIVMPAIIMAFLTMSFMILDRIVFDEDIGVATLLSKDKVEEMRGAENGISKTVVADPTTAGISKQMAEKDGHYNAMIPVFSGNANSNLASQFYRMDFRSDEAGTIGKIFFSFVALLLISYILMSMLGQLISLSQVMVGGGFFMEKAVMGEDGLGNVFEKGLSNVQQTTQQSLNKSLKGATNPASRASAFASGLTTATGKITEALTNAMSGRR